MYNSADLEIRDNRRIVVKDWDSEIHFTYITIVEVYGDETERRMMLRLILSSLSA